MSDRGQRVTDYNRYHLSRPPRGYEWRRVDNNYVLAAAATGIIASILFGALILAGREIQPSGVPAMIQGIVEAENNHDTADLFYMLVDKGGRRIAGELRLKQLPRPGYSDFGDDAHVEGVAHGRALARMVGDGDTLVVVSDNDVIDDFDRWSGARTAVEEFLEGRNDFVLERWSRVHLIKTR